MRQQKLGGLGRPLRLAELAHWAKTSAYPKIWFGAALIYWALVICLLAQMERALEWAGGLPFILLSLLFHPYALILIVGLWLCASSNRHQPPTDESDASMEDDDCWEEDYDHWSMVGGTDPTDPTDLDWYWHPSNPMSYSYRHRHQRGS